MQADAPDVFGQPTEDSDVAEGQDSRLQQHLARRIHRSFVMFGRAPTLSYLARLAAVDVHGHDQELIERAEDALGFDRGEIDRLMREAGAS